jgi:hypothetical protein
VKEASKDLRFRAVLALHDRAYGEPAQNVSIDIALKKAVEGKDPTEQLRILKELRQAYIDCLTKSPVLELEAAE